MNASAAFRWPECKLRAERKRCTPDASSNYGSKTLWHGACACPRCLPGPSGVFFDPKPHINSIGGLPIFLSDAKRSSPICGPNGRSNRQLEEAEEEDLKRLTGCGSPGRLRIYITLSLTAVPFHAAFRLSVWATGRANDSGGSSVTVLPVPERCLHRPRPDRHRTGRRPCP
jgi:hypothetical protein